MASSFPKSLCPPDPLSENQSSSLATILSGFRLLYELLDSTLLPGPDKVEALSSLTRAKRAADDAVRYRVPKLTMAVVADLFAAEEACGRRVSTVVLNNSDFCDFQLDPDFRENFALEVGQGALATGLVGSCWAAFFYVHASIPVGSVFLLTDDKAIALTKSWKAPKKKLRQI